MIVDNVSENTESFINMSWIQLCEKGHTSYN